jgi:signal transduction histidine kinase
MSEDRGNQLAMMVYPSDHDGDQGDNLLAASTGWGEGKPEVSRNLDDVFRGLTLGIKFQGTSADAIASRWVQQSFLILGVLSLLMIGGLVLTYRSVSKEMALARLKSDFVSNVSHELRTPLSLIQLYAETLELGAGSADAVLFSVLGAVQDFAGSCPLADDTSLVVVRRYAPQGSA